jgi:hypothetical protein
MLGDEARDGSDHSSFRCLIFILKLIIFSKWSLEVYFFLIEFGDEATLFKGLADLIFLLLGQLFYFILMPRIVSLHKVVVACIQIFFIVVYCRLESTLLIDFVFRIFVSLQYLFMIF